MEVTKPIKVGNVWTNLISGATGESVNFEEVSNWYDGTPMDDSKADGVIYRKLPTSVGGGYVKRVFTDGVANIKWLGPTETEDLAPLLEKLSLAGADKILIPSGSYTIKSPVTLTGSKSIVGEGNVNIGFEGEYEDGILIKGEGTLPLPPIDADIYEGSTQVVFTSAPGLSVGDIFFIRDNTDNSYSSWRTYYKQGEFFEVADVSGNVVTTTTKAYASYQASNVDLIVAAVHSPATGIVSGLSLDGGGAKVNSLLTVQYACGYLIDNVIAKEGYSNCIRISNSYGCQLTNISATKLTPAVEFNTNYGVMVSNCQDILLNNINATSIRHAIAIGGQNKDADVINRNISISNSILKTTADVPAADIHGNSEFITYQGNTIWGAILRGNHIVLRDNTIYSIGNTVVTGEMSGTDYTIEGNKIYLKADQQISGGAAIDFGGVSVSFDGRTTKGGCINITNNNIVVDSGVNNNTLVMVQNRGCDEDIQVRITNNVATQSKPGVSNTAFANVRNYQTDEITPYKQVVISNNVVSGGIVAINAEHISIVSNTISDSSTFGALCQVNQDLEATGVVVVSNNIIENIRQAAVVIEGVPLNPIGRAIIEGNKFRNTNAAPTSSYKAFIHCNYVDEATIINNIGREPSSNNENKMLLSNIGRIYRFNNSIESSGTVVQPFTQETASPVLQLDVYGWRVDSGGDFDDVGYSPVNMSASATNAPPAITGVSRWWTYKQITDNLGRDYQFAVGNASASTELPVMAFRVYSPATSSYTPWSVLGNSATVSIKGLVNQASASADTAAPISAAFDQTEVQAILTELRDLKTKMRAAGILDT